jgi:hypothetical protein
MCAQLLHVEVRVVGVGGQSELLPLLVRGDLGLVDCAGDGVGVSSEQQSQRRVGNLGDLENGPRRLARI